LQVVIKKDERKNKKKIFIHANGIRMDMVFTADCLFFQMISQKLMQLGSTNLTQMFYDDS